MIVTTQIKIFGSIVQTEIYLSIRLFSGVNFCEKNYSFIIFHSIEVKTLGLLEHTFRQGWQNCILPVQNPEEHLGEKKLFREIRFFIFGLWWEIYKPPERSSGVFFSVHRNNLRRNSFFESIFYNLCWIEKILENFPRTYLFSLKKISFLINFGYWTNIFRFLVVKSPTWLSKCHSNCSAVLSKLHSTLPNEQFGEKFFWRKIIFLSVSIFSTERSWPSVKKFPVDLPKLTSKYA